MRSDAFGELASGPPVQPTALRKLAVAMLSPHVHSMSRPRAAPPRSGVVLALSLVLTVSLGFGIGPSPVLAGERATPFETAIAFRAYAEHRDDADRDRRDAPLEFWYFHAQWCSWCIDFQRETLASRDVIARLDPTRSRWAAVEVDIDEHRAAFARFGGRGLPFVVVTAPGGDPVLARFTGHLSARDLAGLLDRAEATDASGRDAAAPAPLVSRTGRETPDDATTIRDRDTLLAFIDDVDDRASNRLTGTALLGTLSKRPQPLALGLLLHADERARQERGLALLAQAIDDLHDRPTPDQSDPGGGFFFFHDPDQTDPERATETAKRLGLNAAFLMALAAAAALDDDPRWADVAASTVIFVDRVLRLTGGFSRATAQTPPGGLPRTTQHAAGDWQAARRRGLDPAERTLTPPSIDPLIRVEDAALWITAQARAAHAFARRDWHQQAAADWQRLVRAGLIDEHGRALARGLRLPTEDSDAPRHLALDNADDVLSVSLSLGVAAQHLRDQARSDAARDRYARALVALLDQASEALSDTPPDTFDPRSHALAWWLAQPRDGDASDLAERRAALAELLDEAHGGPPPYRPGHDPDDVAFAYWPADGPRTDPRSPQPARTPATELPHEPDPRRSTAAASSGTASPDASPPDASSDRSSGVASSSGTARASTALTRQPPLTVPASATPVVRPRITCPTGLRACGP